MNGPEQDGATGNVDSNIEEGHWYIPPDPAFNNTWANLIMNTLIDKLGTQENPLRMSTSSNILNEYATSLLQSMCFPRLFPYGVGDITRISHSYDVSLTESNRHL